LYSDKRNKNNTMKLTYQNKEYKISFHTELVDYNKESNKEIFVWYPNVNGYSICVEPNTDFLHFLFADTKKELINLIDLMANENELYFIENN
jgi:hypothetical protein